MALQLLFEAAGLASGLSHEPLGFSGMVFTLVRGASEIKLEKRRFLQVNFNPKRCDHL